MPQTVLQRHRDNYARCRHYAWTVLFRWKFSIWRKHYWRKRACFLLLRRWLDKLPPVVQAMVSQAASPPMWISDTYEPNPKKAFMTWCSVIRDEVLAQNDNATERVELEPGDVALCYRKFGRALITHNLHPCLRSNNLQDRRYRLRSNTDDDTHLSKFQRSFTDSMLWTNLGGKRVAMQIWQHGLPDTLALLQSMPLSVPP